MYQIIVTGLSHKTAPLEIREGVAIQDERYEDILSDLSSRESILECLVLSTCNRTEFYLVTNDYENCINEVNDSLLNFLNIKEDIVKENFYSFSNIKFIINILIKNCQNLAIKYISEPDYLYLKLKTGKAKYFWRMNTWNINS